MFIMRSNRCGYFSGFHRGHDLQELLGDARLADLVHHQEVLVDQLPALREALSMAIIRAACSAAWDS